MIENENIRENISDPNKLIQTELQAINNMKTIPLNHNKNKALLENSFEDDLTNDNNKEDLNKINKNKEDENKKNYVGSGKPVGFFELYFKFASKSDTILIILAMIGSLGSGLSMPLFSVLFGGKIN